MQGLIIILVLVATAVGPAMLSGTALRRLKGWTRGVAVAVLPIGLTAIPYVWLEPRISEANKHSPDAGGYVAIVMVILMAIILVSTLVGFAVGGVIVYRRQHRRALDLTAVF